MADEEQGSEGLGDALGYLDDAVDTPTETKTDTPPSEDLEFVSDTDKKEVEQKPAEPEEVYDWQPSDDYKTQWDAKGEEGEKRYEEFKAYAKEKGLKGEVFKDLMTRYQAEISQVPKSVEAQLAKEWAKTTQDWHNQIKNDEEVGGEKYAESKRTALIAVKELGGKELADELLNTGFGNNPKIFKAFYRAGKMMSEKAFSTGKPVTPEKPYYEKIYNNEE